MQSKCLNDAAGEQTWALILEIGDEAMDCLQRFAREHDLDSASFKAIGAFERADLAFFDWDTKQYLTIPVREQTEVASLIGDVATGPDGTPAVHVHVVLGRRDGTALAGHLKKGYVRPTLEVVLTETQGYLHKQVNPEVGLALISIG